ncbi:MAG: undecaprenyldiphospho-muramoylpentapeptide beta-N-acetylglucosaminyltransferase [Candidatus Riflebacteria bacterium]|nr:undecaprenyldiphospho-muramoylpentapeptide beta-N-acetylglucosaminyltransferase [Candidatus Riflebacteria bacterium]
MKKIVLSGGGTGGHIYPAIAIKEILSSGMNEPAEFLYIGQSDGMESKIVPREQGISFIGTCAQGMPRELSMKWFSFPFKNLRGFFDAFKHLLLFSPDLAITTGGFVAFPVLLASKLLKIPYAIHEQNAAMGVTNKFFADGAKRILLTYPDSYPADEKRVVVTGNPVRKAFSSEFNGKKFMEKNPGEMVLLFVGGSRGAASINRACVELSRDWLLKNPKMKIIHITGERDFQEISSKISEKNSYIVLPYLHEMREAFEVADLIISRAGATILAEIACIGKPAILIPFPFATDNHQEKNARILEKSGGAKVILDYDLSGETLRQSIESCLAGECLKTMGEKMKDSRPKNVETRIFEAIKPILG